MAASRSRSRSPVQCMKSTNYYREPCTRRPCTAQGQSRAHVRQTRELSEQGSGHLKRHQRQNAATPHLASNQPDKCEPQVATRQQINNNSTKGRRVGKSETPRTSQRRCINVPTRPNTRSSCQSQTAVTSRPRTRSGSRSETTFETKQSTHNRHKQGSSSSRKTSRKITPTQHQADTPCPRPSTSTGTRRQGVIPKSDITPRCQSELFATQGSGRPPKGRRKGKSRRLAPFRTKSPIRQMTKAEKERNIQELIYRIESLPLDDRPIPNTTDTTVLGFELKVRLGARAPSLVETGQRGRQVRVTESNEKTRLIPVLDITPDQDPNIHCSMRVKKVAETRRRGRGAR